MIITTDISDRRAAAIETVPWLIRDRSPALVRVLYYLAHEADRLEEDGSLPIEAGMAADLFDDAIQAAKRGELR